MARKVWLTITGIQKGFDQEEPVTLVTEGSYIYKKDVHYIFYSERTEEGAVIKNRLTISPGSVELRKTGAGNFNSVLVFDTQHNKNCIYQSPAGPMELVYACRVMPSSFRIFAAIAPAATLPMVSRPEERPPPL